MVTSWPVRLDILRKFVSTIALVIVLFALVACGRPPGKMEVIDAAGEGGMVEDLYINSQLVECEGVAPQYCMQVRRSPDDDWDFFYGQIEGFTFEPGYAYKVRVRVTSSESVPADASALRYALIEVEEKIPA